MTFPASTHVGRLYVESRHRPATQGGGGDTLASRLEEHVGERGGDILLLLVTMRLP